MPDSQLFSLAQALDYLLDGETSPPWIVALLALPLLGLFFWFITLNRLPTRAEDTAKNRHRYCRGIVRQKYLDSRGYPILSVANNQEEETTSYWLDYLPATLAADTAAHPTAKQLRQYSLAAYAQPGDSLLKKPGELSAIVKRGPQVRQFFFRSSWP